MNLDQIFGSWGEPGEEFLFFFLDKRTRSNDWQWLDPLSSEGRETIRQFNEERGWDAFYSPHVIQRGQKTASKDSVLAYRVIPFDWDKEDVPLPSFEIEPTCIFETSPGKYHVQWYLSDGISAEDFDGVMQTLKRNHGCDAGYTGQLVRVPETLNQKDAYKVAFGKAPRGRIVGGSGRRYSRLDILAAFPPIPPDEPTPRGRDDEDRPRYIDGDITSALAFWQSALGAVLSKDVDLYRLASMAFCEGFEGSEEAYAAWDEECRKHPRYDEEGNREDWAGFCRTIGREGNASLGTLHSLAIAAGWTDPRIGSSGVNASDLEADELSGGSFPITDKAMAYLEAFFSGINQAPDGRFKVGLRNIGIAAEAILNGASRGELFISSLAAGVGKSTTVVFFIKAALELFPETFSCLIVGDRHEELDRFASQLVEQGVPESEIGRYDGKRDSSDDWERARRSRILLTTKSKLEASFIRTGLPFAEMPEYAYGSTVRPLIFWDESFNAVHAASVDANNLHLLLHHLSRKSKEYYRELQMFLADIIKDESVIVAEFPKLEIGFDEWRAFFPKEEHSKADLVHHLMGKQVRVSRNGREDTAWITYTPRLPPDLPGRMVVLDASGQFVGTYKLLDHATDQPVRFLPSPEKGYGGLTIHHWEKGTGSNARRDGETWSEMAQAVVDSILRDVPEGKKALVISHKAKDRLPEFAELVEKSLGERAKDVQFTTYGWHTATNAYRDCQYVFLMGLFIQPRSYYEALARGVMGTPLEDEFPNWMTQWVEDGEIRHHTYQAACRGAVRALEGDSCPEGVHLYVMCSGKGLEKGKIHSLFPGSRLLDWDQSLGIPEKRAFDAIVEYVRNEGTDGAFSERMKRVQLATLVGQKSPKLFDAVTDKVLESLVKQGISLKKQENGRWELSYHGPGR